MDLSYKIAAGARQLSHSRFRVPRNSWPHVGVPDSRLPLPGELGLRIYIPQEQGGPVITPDTGSHFRCLLDSQGYGLGIRTRLNSRGLLKTDAHLINIYEFIPT
jgi:hypothetical protein